MLLSRVSRKFATVIKCDTHEITIHLLRSSREYRWQTYASENKILAQNIRFLKTVWPFMKTISLFLLNKQAIFLAVSKFCLEVVSQNFAVFL